MARELFHPPQEVYPGDDLLEPVDERLPSDPPPEAHRAKLERDYGETQASLRALGELFAFNERQHIRTPEHLTERYAKLRRREQRLRRYLKPQNQLGLEFPLPEPPTSRAA